MKYGTHFEPLYKQVIIGVGLVVVGFMTFGLALSFYRNAMFDQTLLTLEADNEKLRQENLQSLRELEYYQSPQFKDKYAKDNSDRLRPGEQILVITQSQDDLLPPETDEQRSERQQAAFDEIIRQMPALEHWKLYLFQRQRLEELKRSL